MSFSELLSSCIADDRVEVEEIFERDQQVVFVAIAFRRADVQGINLSLMKSFPDATSRALLSLRRAKIRTRHGLFRPFKNPSYF